MIRIAAPVRARLRSVLEQSATIGLLGRGGVDPHIDHALWMADAVANSAPAGEAILDLGAGGGIPGLVVAAALAPTAVVLLDTGERRCTFLRLAADELVDIANLSVAEGRAEVLAREPAHAGCYGAVTARSFGKPAVTAECATAFLRIGGVLVASEPPSSAGAPDRWEGVALQSLGLSAEAEIVDPVRLAILRKIGPHDERYPRRAGIPAKRPLW